MNYCASPEDKWLLVDLLDNTTLNRTLVFINFSLIATY